MANIFNINNESIKDENEQNVIVNQETPLLNAAAAFV